MSNIQIKGVPEELHARLRERAQREGISMRGYVLRVLERELRLDGIDEWLGEAERLEPLEQGASAEEIVELIRDGREERAKQIIAAAADRSRSEG